MWNQQCYLVFETGGNHHAQLHLHSGVIFPPLLLNKLHAQFDFLVCVCVYSNGLFLSTEHHKQQVPPGGNNFVCWLVGYDWYVIYQKQHTLFFALIYFIQKRTDPSLLSTAPFSASNTSLNYLRSTLGRSYMCNAEQVLDVVPTFSLNTFKLQVQPFNVTTNQFATGNPHFITPRRATWALLWL